jgi:pimeloyl-ACP methyl ester carboxylesterase
MHPLQQRLATRFSTLTVDWPGFGDLPRPAVVWRPGAYRAFVRHILTEVCPEPYATIAAGHAAGYVLDAAAKQAGLAGRLVLIAPTWRGPLPTLLGRRHPAFTMIAGAVDLPLVGRLLYRINVNRPIIRMMTRAHVYDDPNWLRDDRLAAKQAVARAIGARHASFRFVTGQLDPMLSRDEFLKNADHINEPILVLYGFNTPRKSKAEIESLASARTVRLTPLPNGKLAVHEEYPQAVAEEILAFLAPHSANDV